MHRLLIWAGLGLGLVATSAACGGEESVSDWDLSASAVRFPCTLIQPTEAVALLGAKLQLDEPSAFDDTCYYEGQEPAAGVVRPMLTLSVDHGGIQQTGPQPKEISSLGSEAVFYYINEHVAEVAFVLRTGGEERTVTLSLARYDRRPEQGSLVAAAKIIAKRAE